MHHTGIAVSLHEIFIKIVSIAYQQCLGDTSFSVFLYVFLQHFNNPGPGRKQKFI